MSKVIVLPGGIIRRVRWYGGLGRRLDAIPPNAKITYADDTRLSDLQAVGVEVRFIPR